MGAIKPHKTAVDKTGSWDGPKAVADAPNDAAVLRYMHAWINDKGDANAKGSYKFPHHNPGTDTPAVIAGVNNALSRLPQASIPAGDRAGVEAHLRKHRKDAGLEESMSEAEIAEAIRFIKRADDLKVHEAKNLTEAVRLQEQANLGDWLEARLHMMFTDMADSMFGDGYMTRDERIILSSAIGDALDAFRSKCESDAAQIYQRRPYDGPPEDGGMMVSQEAATIKSKARAAARALQSLLSDKTLPKDLHDSVEGVVAALQKTWADLAADSNPPAAEAASPQIEERNLGGEISIEGDFVPLIEKAIRRDGTIPIKIIQAGWGSSGFYPAEVLKRDGPKVFTKETKMYWNHQTPEEESQRPEGDLNNLAAVLVNDAAWQDNGAKGAGLYADAKVFEAYQKPVDDLAKNIGVSIRAMGQAVHGSAEGKNGAIIQALTARKSIDFVTEPGAGGEIITMFEAARSVKDEGRRMTDESGTVPGTTATEAVSAQGKATITNVAKNNMEDDMEVRDLQEKVAALETNNQTLVDSNARLSEAMAIRDAKEMVREAIDSLSSLPNVTKARLIEGLSKNPPMKDGVLDKEALPKLIQEVVKTEVKYLESVLGTGQIRGLGESKGDDDQSQETLESEVEASLTESFGALGMSEKGARIAAKGRG
jgi:hypothetical protein